jgi:putative addiction module component (TIGR02574 family)
MAEPLDELLRRPPDERARAALRLIESLDEGDDADAAEAQGAELERRMEALAGGSAQLIDGDEVRRDGLALLRALRDE